MKLLKKYGPGAAALLLIWLAKHFCGEKGEQAAVLLMMAAVVIVCVIVFAGSRRKHRYCPKCGCGTETGWRTEKIDASQKPVRIGSKWHFGGHVTQKTAIIRGPGCGWEIDLGK